MLNRELNSDFVLTDFEHVADWDVDNEWIDIRIRSLVDQTVTIGNLDMTLDFVRGEEICTEISAKFRLDGITAELGDQGLEVVGQWTDENDDFALSLAVKTD